ncbi:hypothetical protein RH858_16675, partial [Halalkaliarchaeum sp. AArc-GB]|uniref:hypothetical protein n=1 Tax=Halalkaliarchaeum sp. AArc-GB TaxID=3074078 RepID=UPI002866DF61
GIIRVRYRLRHDPTSTFKAEVITRNVNAGEIDHVRSDVEADEETVHNCCVDLVDLDLLEEEVGEYSITIDGENVLTGKIGLEDFEQPN